MVRYSVFARELRDPELGSYTGWGIEGREEDGSPTGRVEDLTEDRDFALLVAAALNREQVEAVHLRDSSICSARLLSFCRLGKATKGDLRKT